MVFRRVVVTGLGAVSPLSVGYRTSWNQLLKGNSGIDWLRKRGDIWQGIPSQVAGLVPHGSKASGGWTPTEHLDRGDERIMALFTQYAVAASKEAMHDAGIENLNDTQKENVGVVIGSGIGSLSDIVHSTQDYYKEPSNGYRRISPYFIPRLLINLAAGHVSMKNGFLGPCLSPSTACTTGAHAIGDAFNLIRYSDETDIVLAGASESCIDPLALAGFARARALSTACRQQDEIDPSTYKVKPGTSSRPFDKQRDGFVIAEGAAVLVLEELTHALRRGANIYAEVVGYGCASDAHHITAPHPSGRGAYLSMKRALQDASIKPVNVSYINAHATGTPTGDDAENRAIRRLMLDTVHGKRHAREVNVSSTKGATGHLLGAAGALEGVFSVLAVHEDIMPPTINLSSPGNLDGEHQEEWDLNYVANELQRTNVDVVLSNSFGFGGTCASLCFKKYTEATG